MTRSRLLVILTALALGSACSEASTGNTSGNSDASGAGGIQFGDAKVDSAGSDAGPSGDTVLEDANSDADGKFVDDTAFNCTVEGQTVCFNETVVKACIEGEWQFAEKCLEGETCVDGKCGTPTNCTPGKIEGCDGPTAIKKCADNGKAFIVEKCPSKQQCVQGECKQVVCTPGFGTCLDKDNIQECKADGSGFAAATKCKPGSFCFGGKCVSLCETNLKISNNVGCEYWAADLDSSHDTFSAATTPGNVTPDFLPHSVVISNPGQFDAEITVTIASSCGATLCEPVSTCGGKNTECKAPSGPYPLKYTDFTVKAGGTKEFKMPVMNVDGSGITRKAIRINSTQPVVAFQFNPFDAQGAASNDGSLLLPVNTLGKTYYVVALSSRPEINIGPKMPSQNGYFTVVASTAGETTVEITPTDKITANPKAGVPQDGSTPATLEPGKTYTFKLKQFDVLNLEHAAAISLKGVTDLTGTKIQADKAVAVFCGHEEAVIGNEQVGSNPDGKDSCCAEHIEEQMMPLEAWGTEALCAKTKPRGSEKDLWYVVAGEDNVELTTVPPTAISGKKLAKAGNYVVLQTEQSFQLKATGKIQVVQFIVSRGQTEEFTGDPTMMVVPPKSQYREEYLIQTADGYGTNWVTVVRPKGMEILQDGVALSGTGFAGFGDGSYEVGYFATKKGTHTFASKDGGAFGLMVYGYGNATAYGYPGGMNLK
jgi:hypothetical protein